MAIAAGAKVDATDFGVTAWTPVFGSFTTGTGSTVQAWYTKVGNLVNCQFHLIFGTSPTSSATWTVDLPFTANVLGLQSAFGSWVFRDNSTVLHYAGTIAGFDGGGTQVCFSGALNTSTSLNSGRLGGTNIIGTSGTAPNFAVATGDTLSGQMTYRST